MNKPLQPLFDLLPSTERVHGQILSNDEYSIGQYTDSIQLAMDAVVKHFRNSVHPFSGVKVADLKEQFSRIDLNESIPQLDAVIEEVEQLYMQHAVSFHIPEYVAHLNCPVVIPALVGELILTALNSSLDTWDQSAGGTLIEQKLVRWTCDEIGFGEQADGVFTSGGTQSNLMAVLLSRDRFSADKLRHNTTLLGLHPDANRFRIFVSDAAHFSIQKNAAIVGLGHNCVVKVKCDRSYRMNTVLLEDAIKRELEAGNIPIAVVATAGTTDFSSIDPLPEIGVLASRYDLWYHVDAAYGCGLLLTDLHRHKLNGIEKADSVTVDYHKSFFQPVSSSAFLVKEKRSLSLITHHADYLNPKENDEESYPNQVNKSIQTTRRFDALKLWFTLRCLGKKQLGEWTEQLIAVSAESAEIIAADRDLELLNYPQISAILFRYHPKGFPSQYLNQVNEYIRKALFREGKAIVAGTKVKGEYFLKFTILNPLTSTTTIRKVINLIKEHAKHYNNLN